MVCTEWLKARAVMISGTTITSGSSGNPMKLANPNPQIATKEDFADSALAAGLEYPHLIQRIVNIGRRGRP